MSLFSRRQPEKLDNAANRYQAQAGRVATPGFSAQKKRVEQDLDPKENLKQGLTSLESMANQSVERANSQATPDKDRVSYFVIAITLFKYLIDVINDISKLLPDEELVRQLRLANQFVAEDKEEAAAIIPSAVKSPRPAPNN